MTDGRASRSRSSDRPPGGPRPLGAAALSMLLPGAGQWLARRRRRGALLIGVTVVGLGAALALASGARAGDGLELAGWVLSARGLAVLMMVNAVLAVARLGVTVDAWVAARRDGARAGRMQVGGLAVLLLAGVVAPHAMVGLAGAETRRVVDAVFVDAADRPESAPSPSRSAPAGEPTVRIADAADAADAAEAADAADAQAGDDPEEELGEPAEGAAKEDDPVAGSAYGGADRLTVLLLGSDAGHDRSGTRVDVMVVATMDVASGDVALISVPRNLADVPLPGMFGERLGERYPKRLMSLYPAAAGDPVLADAYADSGRQAHVAAVEALLDLQIDHVAMADLAGFVDTIDALGGVEVDVSDRIHVRLSAPSADEEWRTYDIRPGRQRLDGHQALAYVRSRTGTDDYDRMRRQRCLVGSLADQTGAADVLRSLPRLADVLVERVETDIPTDAVADLARLAARVDVAGLRTLGITPPTYTVGKNAHGFFSADVDGIQEAVRGLLDGPDASPTDAADLGGTCGSR